MRSLFLTALYLSFIFYGFRAPYILALGYIWVDIYTPQYVAWGILNAIPVSLIMGSLTFVALLFMKKPEGKWFTREIILIFVFAIWMTMTLLWSEVPDRAFDKWNWAVKSIVFCCALPIFIRDKNQIDSLIWVIVLSAMVHCIPYATKVLLSGGGYRANYSVVGGNSGFGEGSTLSLLAVVVIPLCLYLYKSDSLFEKSKVCKLFLIGFICTALLASLGTFARTGLVSLAALAVVFTFLLKRRIYYFSAVSILGVGLLSVMGAQWEARMSTIGDSGEHSAMGRVAVWKWTWQYALDHPFGGGFDVYRINYIELPLSDGGVLVAMAKAFHSIYFEILGELGFVGISIYLLIAVLSLRSCLKIRREMVAETDLWMKNLSEMLLASLVVYMVGGAFIGIAYQSLFYYLVAVVSSLSILSRQKTMQRGRHYG